MSSNKVLFGSNLKKKLSELFFQKLLDLLKLTAIYEFLLSTGFLDCHESGITMSESAIFRKSLWLVLLAKAQNLSLRRSISSGTRIYRPKLVGPVPKYFEKFRLYKVGCVFPMVVSILPCVAFGQNDHLGDTHHFIKSCQKNLSTKTLQMRTFRLNSPLIQSK